MKLRLHSLFTIAVIVVMALAVWEAREWPLRASILILVLGSAGILMGLVQLAHELRHHAGIQSSGMDIDVDEELTGAHATPRILKFAAWLVGLLTGIWMFGFTVSIPIYSLLYARLNGARWLIAVVIAVVNFIFLQGVFEQIIHVPWPDPFLQRWIPFLPG